MNGEFAFKDLPGGEFEVVAEYEIRPGWPGFFRPAASMVQITSDTQHVVVELNTQVDNFYYCGRPNTKRPQYNFRQAGGSELVGRIWRVAYGVGPQRSVPKVKVLLLDSAGKLRASTISDGEGRFDFGSPDPGKYTLVASHRGYKTQIVPLWITRKNAADVELEMPVNRWFAICQ